MRCYCNKCGRKIELTQGELNAQHGQVVCPQCLSVFKVPIKMEEPPPPVPARSRKKAQTDNVPPVPQRRAKAAPVQRARPAVRVAQATTTRAAQVKSTSSPRKAATPRKKSAGKQSKKSLWGFGWQSMTPLGCLTMSVVIALVFFAFYYIIGELMH